jgi:hypothetical protein
MNLLSSLQGLTTPASALQQQIAQAGWEVTKINSKDIDGRYQIVAEARNLHGETLAKTGPNDRTALGNLLVAIMRHNYMRTAAQYKVGMWKTMFTDQLQPIAEAYAKASVYDPKAAAAFMELAQDSVRRADAIKRQLHVEVVDDPEPYVNAKEMADDIHNKRHFYVSRANSNHPLWSVDQNVAFRIVHDVLGHAVSGGDFGWQGENLACAAHFPLLTPNAQNALFTECIGQTAYAAYYRSFGPQKVALFPEFTDPAKATENDPGHMGIHPSQIAVPTSMPSVPDSPDPSNALPEGSIAPHQEALGLTPLMGPSVFSRKYANSLMDPNAGWSSGIDPLHLPTDGVGNAFLDHGDPLDAQGVMDNAAKINTGWSKLRTGDGSFDRERAKLAIVNAFRVVLLSPRKDLRWNAIHYQDIAHIPATTDDPKVYWDTLEHKRRAWNSHQIKKLYGGKVSPETLEEMMEDAKTSHMAWRKMWPQFFSIIFQRSGDYEQAKEQAEETLMSWQMEEQQRIEQEDADRPQEKQRTLDEIERRAAEAVVKRMKLYIADHQPRFDVQAAQETLFEQPEPTAQEKPDRYGAFMGTHLKAISQISQHADELLDAALEDVKSHDGSGHHFRAKVLSLGISGVGPKVCSFAWLLLQPLTSQLATVDTHIMDVLGHNYEKEMNNRDYFKYERELAAGRDAAGYSHVPLGAFQWGMWDHKRTGPGTHQDHSAMRVLDPVQHSNVDWESKVQPIGGGHAEAFKGDWLKNAPDWWRNTQTARDKVAQDWDHLVAPNFPRSGIPYQVGSVVSKIASEGTEDEFHVGIAVPEEVLADLRAIADELNLSDPEDPADYHITAFWSEEGYKRKELHDWVRNCSVSGLRFVNARIDCFPSHRGDWAVVLRLDSPEAKKLVTQMMDQAEDRGLKIRRFDGGWKAHITLGYQDEKVKSQKFPEIAFRAGPLYVSIPRPLRGEDGDTVLDKVAALSDPAPFASYNDGEQDVGAPGETAMAFARLLNPTLSTPEIWKLLGEQGAGKLVDGGRSAAEAYESVA